MVAGARQAARLWVNEVASRLPRFRGAFFHGSINWMSDDDPFSATSDVDVGVVFADSEQPPKLGKTRREGVLIDGVGIPLDRLASSEQLLGDFQLAHSFRTNSIISDPTGHLGRVQQNVEHRFAERHWVLERCKDAKRNCLRYVNRLDESIPYYTQAACWLFAEGNLPHVLLAAGLQNPTVRSRYSAARELLAAAERLDIHAALLAMLGCATMPRSRVEHHLKRMTEAFDRASSVIRFELPFGSDISEPARIVAVDGSRELIRYGEHREAIFWIAVTYARCMAVLELDGPPGLADEFTPGFRALMGDLGVEGFEDMQRRSREIEAFLPGLMAPRWRPHCSQP